MDHKGRIGDKPAFSIFQEFLSINRLPPQQSPTHYSIHEIKSHCFSCHTATSHAFIHQFSVHTNPRSITLCLLIKQRLALAVRRLRMSNATEQAVTTVVLGSRNINRSHQEDTEDDKGEDPLQSNDLDGNLAEGQSWKTKSAHRLSSPRTEKTLTQRKETETITQNIILPHDDIEQTHQQDHPDKDIGKDTAGQIMAVHGDRAVPEERCEGPGVGSGDGGKVYEGWEAMVAPVGDGLVDEVGDEDDLGAPEVVAGPEENPGEHE